MTTEKQTNTMTKKAVTEQFKKDFRSFIINAVINCPSVVTFLKEADEVMDKIDMSIPLGAILRTNNGAMAVSALSSLRETVDKLKEERTKLSAILTDMGDTELLHLCAHIADKSGEVKHVCHSIGIATFWFNVERHAIVLQQVLDSIKADRLPVKIAVRNATGDVIGYTQLCWEEGEIRNHEQQ